MGNAEARALASSDHSIIVDAVLQEHQELLSADERLHYIDRARFGLFFDVEKSAVPFRIIDQLYDATFLVCDRPADQEVAAGKKDGILFSQLVLPLMLSMPSVSLEEKLLMVFQAADPTKGKENQVPVADLALSLEHLLISSVRRLRGHKTKDVLEFHDRRCQGCGEVPSNVAFECRDCFNGHTVLGLHVTTHLCHHCVGSWQGISLCYEMRHESDHRLDQVHRVANPHTLTHAGVQCSGCGALPIVGPRYQCCDCIDMVDLCQDCHATSEAPLGHSNHHKLTVHDRKSLTLEQEVNNLVQALFLDGALEPVPQADDGFNRVKAILPREEVLAKDQRQILVISQDPSSPSSPLALEKRENQRQLLSTGVVQPMADKDSRYITESEFVEKMLTSEKTISLLTGFDVRHVKLCPFPESITQVSTSKGS